MKGLIDGMGLRKGSKTLILKSYNFGIGPKHDFTGDITNIKKMFEDLEFERK